MDSRGFTLIELMVSVALFAIVMTISVGTLLSLVDADRKAQALKSVMNNLNFAVENMSRQVRVGTTYHCGVSAVPSSSIDTANDCPSGGLLLAFEPSGGDPDDKSDQVVYRLNGSQLERSNDGGIRFIGVTAPEVNITDFKFYVVGTTAGDNQQPKVIITIRGTAGVSAKVQTTFAIQTMASQRLLDIGSYSQGGYYSQGSYYSQASYYSQGSYYSQASYGGKGYSQSSYGGKYSQGSYGGK